MRATGVCLSFIFLTIPLLVPVSLVYTFANDKPIDMMRWRRSTCGRRAYMLLVWLASWVLGVEAILFGLGVWSGRRALLHTLVAVGTAVVRSVAIEAALATAAAQQHAAGLLPPASAGNLPSVGDGDQARRVAPGTDGATGSAPAGTAAGASAGGGVWFMDEHGIGHDCLE